HASAALEMTITYCKERTAFGQPIGSFQNSRFKLAEMATEVAIGRQFIDAATLALNESQLTAVDASMAKWWCTEM
ncbi:MAG TPA: acyl-CoA dehydrogenase, partial [Acidimicrobiaceae bacterium]|nr:acyl-CoA dehydrogenase [Acidimicrobiaceae bacterium]